jgi:hypothetical protein
MPSTGEMKREKAPFGFGSDGVFGSFAFARIPCLTAGRSKDFPKIHLICKFSRSLNAPADLRG